MNVPLPTSIASCVEIQSVMTAAPPFEKFLCAEVVEAATEFSSDVPSSSTTEFKIEPNTKRMGFIGLAEMGQKKICESAVEAGHDISVWNGTPEQFVDIGVKQFMTISEFVWSCDFIFSCVSGLEASNSIFFGKNCILESLGT
ncbi:oxidoreductase GLYR1 [Trichonephila clavipes]|nr:oxidoreductase GLYR1 [Trichonephila clavipes]